MGNTFNDDGWTKIKSMTMSLGIIILLLHYYIAFYKTFQAWHLTHPMGEVVLNHLQATGLFVGCNRPKLAALCLLFIFVIGTKGRKQEGMTRYPGFTYMLIGSSLFFTSNLLLYTPLTPVSLAGTYMTTTTVGYLAILRGGLLLTRIIKDNLGMDVFNRLQETFPQQETRLDNPYSINLPAVYNLKGKMRKSWINIINPFRGILVSGTPGAGKSYFIIRHIITQHISKGFTMFIYDFKFDDLSTVAYNTFLKYEKNYAVSPKFFVINFDDLSKTHRCNPLDPDTMTDITDAIESARTVMLGLNREWIRKTGDFFVESPINFVTAIIWFLRRYKDGKYCTLPHVIELMQIDYKDLFAVLRTEPEIEVLINPFVTAFTNGAAKQLEGQVGSAKIALSRLCSPQLYYVLSGNDFTLDLNNPKEPKIICVGNNYMKQQIYGAVLSLYAARMIKLVNRKGQLKSSLIFDEFPTIYFNGIDSLMATGRSNLVASTICVQDFSQLQRDYGKSQADVIANVAGNVISGQLYGETAKQLSERFGRIQQKRQSLTINATDTSIGRSTQLDYAIPASKIASLSSGQMVGIVSDNPEQRIQLKVFHADIQNDHKAIKKEIAHYKPIPKIRDVNSRVVKENYDRIRSEVQGIIRSELQRIYEDPDLMHLLVKRKEETVDF